MADGNDYHDDIATIQPGNYVVHLEYRLPGLRFNNALSECHSKLTVPCSLDASGIEIST
ncbi:MAG: hypothetical protein LBE09_07535 [Christensenellaceae bacterium]|nr:hypothetical protein [Christensenellaceae bacterium]